MRRILSVGLAAVTAAAGIMSATAADARDWRYGGGHRYYRHHNHSGDALAAGIVGLALGAAIVSNGDGGRYRSRGYSYGYGYDYGPRYYSAPRSYYYDEPYYRSCRNVRVYDSYYGPVYERRCW